MEKTDKQGRVPYTDDDGLNATAANSVRTHREFLENTYVPCESVRAGDQNEPAEAEVGVIQNGIRPVRGD